MNEIKLFSPGSVSNLGCGFDILGFALNGAGDKMLIRKNNNHKIAFTSLKGHGPLPTDPDKNVAGIAAKALLQHLKTRQGVDIEIQKNILPGSGIGSSAASAAGAVVGINKLLGSPLSKKELIPFAMKGEALASGNEHADNVAPAILGGITLIRSYEPLEIISVPVPDDLFCVLLHPQIEIKTSEARNILKKTVPLSKAIRQWGNVGGLIAGFYSSDYKLIGNSLTDYIIEEQRAPLIPGYYEVKKAALNSGALGCNISGSGPSVFALVKGKDKAMEVKEAMESNYAKNGISFHAFVSEINKKGVSDFE